MTHKSVLGWIAIALGCLALIGLIVSTFLSHRAEYISIADLPLFCFDCGLQYILGVFGLVLGLFGLLASNRRPALVGIALNSLVFIIFLATIILDYNPDDNRVLSQEAAFTPQPGVYDMAAYACQADWYYPSYMITGSGNLLLCGSERFKSNGLVMPLEEIVLSNGETVGPAIRLEKIDDREFLAGSYPLYEVQPGAHLVASFGCAQDQVQCCAEMGMGVNYEGGLTTQKNANVLISYGQPPVEVELDLSDLAGERVIIGFGMNSANQSWSACQATIIAPRIIIK